MNRALHDILCFRLDIDVRSCSAFELIGRRRFAFIMGHGFGKCPRVNACGRVLCQREALRLKAPMIVLPKEVCFSHLADLRARTPARAEANLLRRGIVQSRFVR